MFTINAGSTIATAFLRAFITGMILGLSVAFGVYAVTDTATYGWKPVIVAFGITFFGTQGLRGFAEGLSDNARQKAGDVRPGDVTPNP